VWKLNVESGQHELLISLPEMKAAPPPALPMAINGLKVRDGYLYWSNTSAETFCRILISASGEAAGDVEVLARECLIDDFVFDGNGNAWLAQHGLNRASVLTKDGRLIVVAGKEDELSIAGATACRFGRREVDKEVLYCVTTGGLSAPVDGVTEGGKVVSVDTSTWEG
jgi:sugar lactone lactonase YvrE